MRRWTENSISDLVVVELHEEPHVVLDRYKLSKYLAQGFWEYLALSRSNIASSHVNDQWFMLGIEMIIHSETQIECTATAQILLNTKPETCYIYGMRFYGSRSVFSIQGVVKLNYSDVWIEFFVEKGPQELEAMIVAKN